MQGVCGHVRIYPQDTYVKRERVVPTSNEPVALPEAVRGRVVGLAAQALGSLPADNLPAPLRPVARFAPAKRARAAGPMIATALEAHEDFRARVAELLPPELAAAVRAGAPPPAADPVEVATVAYLVRPDGWRELISLAGIELADRAERASAKERDDIIAKLTQERDDALAEARERVDRARADADTAIADAQSLRKQVRALTGQLRAAERERDAARETAETEQRRAREREDAITAEIAGLRAEITEAERATEAARRTSRAARDTDDARLWLLLETAAGAVRGLRDELALAPPSRLPADEVHAATAEVSSGVREVGPVDLDRLLALPRVHVIVDGYNVTKTGYGDQPLAAQRTRLIQGLGSLVARTRAEVTCVFDGATGPPMMPIAPRGVRVLFSAPGEQADDLIRRLVAAEPEGRPVLVVSSDREVAAAARRPGAVAVPSAVLVRRLDRS
jgi:predicted RNA-binding protein with PIN domain